MAEELEKASTPPEAPPFAPEKPRRGRPPGSKTRNRTVEAETDAPDLRSVEAAWQGLWLILRVFGSFVGFVSDVKVLPDSEAREDAQALLPIVQRHPFIARVLGWIGAPVVLATRISQHFTAKKKVAPKAQANGHLREVDNVGSLGAETRPS